MSSPKHTIEEIQRLFELRGAVCMTSVYTNCRQPITFKCSNCHELHTIRMKDFDAGKNQKLLCPDCQKASTQRTSVEELREEFAAVGATLVEPFQYENSRQIIPYLCAGCGRQHHTTWELFSRGVNRDLLCPKCQAAKREKVDLLPEIRVAFEALGAEVLSEKWEGWNVPVDFKCSKCGKPYSIYYKDFKRGRNKNLLCDDCLRGFTLNPSGAYGKNRRQLVDAEWLRWIPEFFNVSSEDFASHHIHPFMAYTEERTSFTNGFPVWKQMHARDFVYQGLHDPFHHDWLNASQYPLQARTPHQDYDGFKFHDLSTVLQTQIIYDESVDLLWQKRMWEKQGVEYMPFFFDELFLSEKRQIAFSMIRAKLWTQFPDIYQYTGVVLRRLQARKLYAAEISSKEAKEFLNANHIQGFYGTQYHFGLFDGSELVAVQSYGPPRFAKCKWELIRSAVALNTQILGGTAKLFNHAKAALEMKECVAYADLRFSSMDADKTVYPRLGFKFNHCAQPATHYLDKETNRFYNRMMFQKHKLESRLKVYDAAKTARQNLADNNIVPVKDCGNLVFYYQG